MTSESTPYQLCVRHAAIQGGVLIRELIETAREQIYHHVSTSGGLDRRNALLNALRLLNQHERFLCRHFPDLLLAEFMSGAAAEAVAEVSPKAVNKGWIDFDQLELMDDLQVQERVEVARIQQAAVQATEGEISELNRLICGAQGLERVHADRNPMRPEVYARTLRTVLLQTREELPVRLIWMQYMGEALGKALAATYADLSRMLHHEGVAPATYLVTNADTGRRTGSASPDTGDAMARAYGMRATDFGRPENSMTDLIASPQEEKLLTLGHLRRLLAGELDNESQVVQQTGAARTVATPAQGFSQTVPAAFEVLQEMKQVETVMKRLSNRQRDTLLPEGAFDANQDASLLRAQFRRDARGMGQALGLEVVTLMVDNIANDSRLLAPVREAVLTLEPALLRLALKDPRFFSDRQHAARRLLEEITHRSLGFDSVEAEGFGAFIQPVQSAVEALALIGVEGPEPFEMALSALEEDWTSHAAREDVRREKAVRALMHIELRNLRAEKISAKLRTRADVKSAPFEVVEMLLGPWSQVLAHARLNPVAQGTDPGGYGALVSDLLWSVNPEGAGCDKDRLLGLIPDLTAKLRQGLGSIDFPAARINSFLGFLAGLHQQILQPVDLSRGRALDFSMSRSELDSRFNQADQNDVWLVGEEGRDTGFLDSLPALEHGLPASSKSGEMSGRPSLPSAPTPPDKDARVLIQPGAWVELLIQNKWVRAQLTWASPQGSLFMFNRINGGTHSMTRRSFERLCEEGSARLIAVQALVDGALDAVAQVALRNSVDVKL